MGRYRFPQRRSLAVKSERGRKRWTACVGPNHVEAVALTRICTAAQLSVKLTTSSICRANSGGRNLSHRWILGCEASRRVASELAGPESSFFCHSATEARFPQRAVIRRQGGQGAFSYNCSDVCERPRVNMRFLAFRRDLELAGLNEADGVASTTSVPPFR